MIEINKVKIDNIIGKTIPSWKKDVLERDKDKVLLIDGREGSGKSALAMQIASGIDPNFDNSKIAFNGEQFMKMVRDPVRRKGDCIVLDEAFGSANSRSVLTQINKAMVTLATEMRQLNLFVIIVLPSFFDLDRYFAVWRCDTLIHVYFKKDGSRGKYMIFPFNAKKNLYIQGKKFYSYGCVKTPYPTQRFNKGYGNIDEEKYRVDKAVAFRDAKPKEGVVQKRTRERLAVLAIYMKDKMNLTDKEIGDMIDMSRQSVNVLRNGGIVS